MNVLKKLAGVMVFLIALGVAVGVTKFYDRPSGTITKVSPRPPASIPVFDSPSESIPYKAQLISLDFEQRKSFTTLAIERERNGPAPDRLWVWTYFFAPDDGSQKIWAGAPVELREPFANGDEAIVTAAASCGWCAGKDAPRAGYYARVRISTRSSEAARLAEQQTIRDIFGAVPVLVQSEPRIKR